MSLEELILFCKENAVSINVDYSADSDSAVVILQSHIDNRRCKLLVQRECCALAVDKKEHFQFVLDHLLAEFNEQIAD